MIDLLKLGRATCSQQKLVEGQAGVRLVAADE
jgi:hypothetical protein